MKNTICLDETKYLMNMFICKFNGSGKMSLAKYAIEEYTDSKINLEEKNLFMIIRSIYFRVNTIMKS